ncbi:hypothetical protein HF325_004851 [Metschnikowia pulcherrima]|uniref:Reverse transcriptase Ty1/copia-type domain-containing protein n=1 Tax=Metschnikowia pulcherrima TaxID=27326 RepID=A0A8H7LDI1_9ASCO|nr:hypothetical protein HF325_004851 [Metschnikowia pulcherrima]
MTFSAIKLSLFSFDISMELEVCHAKSFDIDGSCEVWTRLKPHGHKATRGEWPSDPGKIRPVAYGGSTITQTHDYYEHHNDLLATITEKIAKLSNLNESVPASLKEARSSPNWHLWVDACNAELSALSENDTFSLALSACTSPVTGKLDWEFSVEDDGVYRAKLTAKTILDFDGTEYELTSRVKPELNSLRLFMAISAQHNLQVQHLKINPAYFYGKVPNVAYFETPPGLMVQGTLQLHKSIHGFLRAPDMRDKMIAKALRTHGFSKVLCNNLFYRGANLNLIIIAVIADDLLIASRDEDKINAVKSKLVSQYKMRDLALAKKVAGINIYQRDGFIKLHLNDYIDSLLKDYSMEGCMPHRIPAGDLNLNVSASDNEESCDLDAYRSLIGKLIYASMTVRMDIDHIVRELIRYLADPKQKHMIAARNVVRYLKGTKLDGLIYLPRVSDTCLQGYATSILGQRKEDSFLGYVMTYSGTPIFWRTRFGKSGPGLHAEALRLLIIQGQRTLEALIEIGFIMNLKIYSNNRQAVMSERKALLKFQPRNLKSAGKRAHEQREANSDGGITVHEHLDPQPALILTEYLPYDAHRRCCSMLNLA